MRPIYTYDLDQVARALAGKHPLAQEILADRIISRAGIADKYRKRLRRNHPVFGSGTLASAIPKDVPTRQPQRCDQAYLKALSVIVSKLTLPRHNKL